MIGWLTIPDTVVDYPVLQSEDSAYYLTRDFYGAENVNGQIVLDSKCDPYAPSRNLIISGKHMKNGNMFGDLPKYAHKSYWEEHKTLSFDSLMVRNEYVIVAAFYSADFDDDEEGFPYSTVLETDAEAEQWLEDIEEYQLYDTGIEVSIDDDFITMTTLTEKNRIDRFIIIARKIRAGEKI